MPTLATTAAGLEQARMSDTHPPLWDQFGYSGEGER